MAWGTLRNGFLLWVKARTSPLNGVHLAAQNKEEDEKLPAVEIVSDDDKPGFPTSTGRGREPVCTCE
jgi:hypothetical protein